MLVHDSQEIAPLSEEPRASFVLLSFLILFFATVFFVNDADWQVSTYENHARSTEDFESQVADGSRWRQLSYVTIGAIGLLMLIVPGRQRISFINLPFALLSIYVLICMASFIWSDAAWLTAKRLAISIFCLLAFMGVAKHLSLRDLIDASLGITAILLIVSWYAEIRLGTFTPWAGDYRFSGVMHPNSQGGNCGVMVIAAFFGVKATRRGKFLYFGLFLLAGGFLMLTKSRTSVAATLLGVSAAWYLFASRNKQALVGLALPAAICAALAALLLFGAELSSSANTAVKFGREADSGLATLNGRLPLWSSLMEDFAKRPLLGHGYQGFWTPERIYEVSLEQEWTVPNGHSVFLDVLLGTGLLGGTILGLSVLFTFHRVIRRCLKTAAPSDCFVLALFVFSLVEASCESGFEPPTSIEAFAVGTALLHLLLRRSQTERAPETTSRPADPLFNWKAVSTGGVA